MYHAGSICVYLLHSVLSLCLAGYAKPWITCPSSVITTLPPGSKEADITLLLGSAKSNFQSSIKMFPLIYNGNLVFPAGKTALYFVARNPIGETANCSILVNIMGKQANLLLYISCKLLKR